MARPMPRFKTQIARILLLMVLALLVAVPETGLVTAVAHAQETTEKRSILQMIFGKPKPKVKKQQPPKRKVRRQSAAEVNPGQPVDVVKLPDAKKILVVGDFMAKALGDGLNVAFAGAADIIVETRSNGSSGLARPDFHDWPAELPKLVDEVKPALVIVMLGANDRQQMSIDGKKQKFRTDIWNTAYTSRTQAFANQVKGLNLPLIWVGLPSFQSDNMTADAATLNGFYRQATEKAGGEFLDIWDGFVDEAGKFAFSGSDINGQSVRLRGSDGLSFTKAGKRKLAFYLEKSIRHQLGNPGTVISPLVNTPTVVLPGNDNKAPVVVVSVPPMSLADPELDGASTLLDADMLPKAEPLTPRDLLVIKGEAGQAPEGRVDDYVIRKPVVSVK